jgi:hypothetical protein
VLACGSRLSHRGIPARAGSQPHHRAPDSRQDVRRKGCRAGSVLLAQGRLGSTACRLSNAVSITQRFEAGDTLREERIRTCGIVPLIRQCQTCKQPGDPLSGRDECVPPERDLRGHTRPVGPSPQRERRTHQSHAEWRAALRAAGSAWYNTSITSEGREPERRHTLAARPDWRWYHEWWLAAAPLLGAAFIQDGVRKGKRALENLRRSWLREQRKGTTRTSGGIYSVHRSTVTFWLPGDTFAR